MHLKHLSLRSKSISRVCWFWFNTPQQLHMQQYNKNCTTVDNVDKPQLAEHLSSRLALNILELQLDFQWAHHPTLHPQPLLGQEKTTLLTDNFQLRLPQVIPIWSGPCYQYWYHCWHPSAGLHTRPDQHWFVSQTRTQILSNKAYSLQCFFYWQNFTIFWEKLGKFCFSRVN